MLAEWSAECSAEDPVLVVPWKDPDGKAAFVDLRANPYDFDAIPEAERYPPLMQALRALNAARSPVFTAKCDVWPLAGEELEQLQLTLDVDTVDAPAGFASYIDLVARERSLFTSFHKHEQWLRRLTRLATPLDRPAAALDCVLRPTLLDLETPQQGYAFSLYVKALAADPQTALEEWAGALDAVVALVRGKDLAR
ncbi:MAG: hypothetical protein ABSG84_15175 [Acidobacteriaceae bacterium]|jgi:hypothetical protein